MTFTLAPPPPATCASGCSCSAWYHRSQRSAPWWFYAHQAKGEVRAVGTASAAGIKTAGHDQPLGLSAFEAMSGSTMRRPTANIWTTKGETLLDLINAAAGREAVSKCARTCTSAQDLSLTARSPAAEQSVVRCAHVPAYGTTGHTSCDDALVDC